ncbi:hypothetical protein SARC_06834, partial [Sphaeroforma arctica JP610]
VRLSGATFNNVGHLNKHFSTFQSRTISLADPDRELTGDAYKIRYGATLYIKNMGTRSFAGTWNKGETLWPI